MCQALSQQRSTTHHPAGALAAAQLIKSGHSHQQQAGAGPYVQPVCISMVGMLTRPMACRAQPVVAAWTKNTLQDHFFKEAKKQGTSKGPDWPQQVLLKQPAVLYTRRSYCCMQQLPHPHSSVWQSPMLFCQDIIA